MNKIFARVFLQLEPNAKNTYFSESDNIRKKEKKLTIRPDDSAPADDFHARVENDDDKAARVNCFDSDPIDSILTYKSQNEEIHSSQR